MWSAVRNKCSVTMRMAIYSNLTDLYLMNLRAKGSILHLNFTFKIRHKYIIPVICLGKWYFMSFECIITQMITITQMAYNITCVNYALCMHQLHQFGFNRHSHLADTISTEALLPVYTAMFCLLHYMRLGRQEKIKRKWGL